MLADEPDDQGNAIGTGRPSDRNTESSSVRSVQESIQNVVVSNQQQPVSSRTQRDSTKQRKTQAQVDLEEKTRQGLTAVARAAAAEQQRQVMEQQRQQRQQQVVMQPHIQPPMQMIPVVQRQANLNMFETSRAAMFGN